MYYYLFVLEFLLQVLYDYLPYQVDKIHFISSAQDSVDVIRSIKGRFFFVGTNFGPRFTKNS